MKVLLTGGGSGGHITPLLAVAQTLKHLDSTVEVIYVGERHSKFASMTEGKAGDSAFDQHYSIFAGKFRRYHGQSWLARLLDVKTLIYNIRDIVFVAIGFVQSWFLIRRLKPDVILMKGGYVGVPVGLAASRRIPLVTHDSDALPGLANRLVGRRAAYHATALPPKMYPAYSAAKTRQVGVIVSAEYQLVDHKHQVAKKKQLGLTDAKLLMVTGGSLGAQSINQAMAHVAPQLLAADPDLQIIHQVGIGNMDCYASYQSARLQVADLLPNLALYLGAADVVVTRAGANTLAELGILGKASVVVPNPHLTGGHQLKNAQYLADKKAIMLVDDSKLELAAGQDQLKEVLQELLGDLQERQQLGHRLNEVTILDGADQLARLILLAARPRSGAQPNKELK